MGTSSSNGGPGGGQPLVPSWLGGGGGPPPPPAGPPPGAPPGSPPGPPADDPAAPPPAPPDRAPLAPPPGENRFQMPRTNLSRFAGSGGSNRAGLGRAMSKYVSSTAGGARQAARRMGASRHTGSAFLGFLKDVQTRGTQEALRALNLQALAGRPIEEILSGLADIVCPESGTIDDGIAREAYFETIVDLAEHGIKDLDALTPDQLQTVFELYATHAIEARICNDIGMKTITLPADIHAAEVVQAQIRDFIMRGVSDALTSARGTLDALTADRVLAFVDDVYESAFQILQARGDAEAEQ